MSKISIIFINVLLCAFGLYGATVQNFQGGAGQTPYVLEQYGSTPAASILSGSLRMLSGAGDQKNVIAFNRTDSGIYKRIVAEWDMNIGSGADGYNFSLLNTAYYGTSGQRGTIDAEEEPGLNGSFAIGFDIYTPDDYQRLGSHEISLHHEGIERENQWSSYDFRTSSFQHVKVEIDFVAGGAEITLTIAGNVIYDKYYLFGFYPYESRVAFGARTGGISTTLYLDNINVSYEEPISSFEHPQVVNTYNRILMNGSARDVAQNFTFPDEKTAYERVIMRLRVEQPSGGWDPWDRLMHICIWDGNTKYEIARFMTPYSKAGDWYFDVTDYQLFLRGNRKLSMFCDSWIYDENTGYWFTVDFGFFKGNPEYRPVKIQNLWNGTPMYGDENDQTMSNFFTDKNIQVPMYAAKTKLRFMVTGHGQGPNANNGAEFISRGRTVTVNNNSYYNVLWKTDCYLNPCRPQGGTWKYSRAGWAPGDSVDPWEIDITGDVAPGITAAIDYVADPYLNTTPDWNNVSRHWVESQIIFYEKWKNEPEIHWDLNDSQGTIVSDSSGSGSVGSMKNMDNDSWTFGHECHALAFDGQDDYVEAVDFKGIVGGGSRTCSAWIKTDNVFGPIIDWGAINAAGDLWDVRLDSSGALMTSVWGGSITGSTFIADNHWHHIAVVLYNDGTPNINEVVLFVDGVQDSISSSTASEILTTMTTNASFGGLPSLGHYYDGLIDNVRIYTKAMSSSEIFEMYSAGPMPGDLYSDGKVDINDFAVLSQFWQSSSASDADMTCDGIVNIDDIEFFAQEWLNQ